MQAPVCRWGFQRRGQRRSSSANTHSEFSTDGLSIAMKYAIIDIERPWLNTVLLNLSNWFEVGFKKHSISNGTINQKHPLQDEAFWLPALPTQIVVIKELKIHTSNMKKTFDSLQSMTSGGASVGFGPFSIGGSHTESEGEVKQTFHMEGEWLVVDGVQIIGWISQILAPSPQLDAPNA